jgi:hypothetical protein
MIPAVLKSGEALDTSVGMRALANPWLRVNLDRVERLR